MSDALSSSKPGFIPMFHWIKITGSFHFTHGSSRVQTATFSVVICIGIGGCCPGQLRKQNPASGTVLPFLSVLKV